MDAGVVEKVLLREAGVWAEVGIGEVSQPLARGFAFRKKQPLQRSFDPDVHRKNLLMAARKKQNAVGDLLANPAQLY